MQCSLALPALEMLGADLEFRHGTGCWVAMGQDFWFRLWLVVGLVPVVLTAMAVLVR
jgi:hypothetical protein